MIDASVRDEFDVLFAMGDLHIPRHNAEAVDKVVALLDDLQPDIFLDGGDIICADCLSTYPKSDSQLVGLQYEIDEAKVWMGRINRAIPKAMKVIPLP